MKKEKLTKEQKEANALFRSLKIKLKGECRERGLRSVELQLDFLKENPATMRRFDLDYQTTISCFEVVILEYKESLIKEK
jgi:hypothetical protein